MPRPTPVKSSQPVQPSMSDAFNCPGHGILDERIAGLSDKIKNRLSLITWLIGMGVGVNVGFAAYLAGAITASDKQLAVVEEKIVSFNEKLGKAETTLKEVERHIYATAKSERVNR